MLYRNFDFVEVKVSEAKPYVFKTSAKIILLFEYNKRLTTFFKMEKQLLYSQSQPASAKLQNVFKELALWSRKV